MTRVSARAFKPLSLDLYDNHNRPDRVGTNDLLSVPDGEQYILRMLVKTAFSDYKLPEELEWVRPLILQAHFHQQNEVGVTHPYCYVTIRKGEVKSITDDEWHVDGFSTGITHLPEQNYIWTDVKPTEFVVEPIKFPQDFNPRKHNIHLYFQDYLKQYNTQIQTFKPEVLYCVDPYIIHRRPSVEEGTIRTFVRISFTPIEINDINNTENPLIKTYYDRDGVKSFRDKLTRYEGEIKQNKLGLIPRH